MSKRITFKQVCAYAEQFGINVERTGREIEIWNDDVEPGCIRVAATVREAMDEVADLADEVKKKSS